MKKFMRAFLAVIFEIKVNLIVILTLEARTTPDIALCNKICKQVKFGPSKKQPKIVLNDQQKREGIWDVFP